MNLIDRINTFESTNETVAEFNTIFLNSPLENFDPSFVVIIGEIAGPDTVRYVTIGKEVVKHNFKPERLAQEENVLID